MKDHLKILGALYIAFSILGILLAFIVFVSVVGGGILSGDEEAMRITSIVGTIIAGVFVFFSIPGLIGGIALLKKYHWSKILVLILGCINLLNIPFGTALGVYTIWVLTQPETEELLISK